METVTATLTVCFEEPFWVGYYERETAAGYEVCKITFGAEPKDYEVHAFLLKHYRRLRFSVPDGARRLAALPANPKRLQRQIQKQTRGQGVGTKAQQALKLQYEQSKAVQKCQRRDCREAEKERKFLLRKEKHREKHRGH